MTAERALAGALGLLLVIVSLVCLARFARRRLLPSWSGPPAWLADAVAAIGILILVAEVLGVLGVFRPLPLVVILCAGAACTVLADRVRPPEPRQDAPPSSSTRAPRQEHWLEHLGAVFALALLAADWVPRVIRSYSVGMWGTDSLWYHGPVAANFVLTGHILPLYNISNDNTIEFYPFSSELVHAVGMTLIGSDVLSPIMNLGWLALALFAGWCIGRRFGVASIALVATAAIMAIPEIASANAGQTYNDVVGVALVMASIALLVNSGYLNSRSSWKDTRAGWFAALAAGLAVGVKYPMLIPVVALTVVFGILAPSGVRLRALGQWLLLVVIGGGLWYARNLVYAGNPLPNAHIDLGFVTLPSAPTGPSPSLSHFITNGTYWRTLFLPGIRQNFGPAWWAVLVLVAIGLIAGLLVCPSVWVRILSPTRPKTIGTITEERERFTSEYALAARILAAVGLATVVGYLFAPQEALPWSFSYNLRYMILGVVCGILALTLAVSQRKRVVLLLLGIFECVLIGTQFAPGTWSTVRQILPTLSGLSSGSPNQAGLTFLVVFALGLIILTVRYRATKTKRETSDPAPAKLTSWWRLAGAAGSIAVVLLGLFSLQHYYLDHRYQVRFDNIAVYRTLAWGNNVHHARIGIDGDLILNYPFNGADFTNSVTFLGRHGPHGADYSITTCTAFVRAIEADHLQYVVVVQGLIPQAGGKLTVVAGAPPATWLDSQLTAHLVRKEEVIAAIGVQRTLLYGIRGTVTPARCTRT